MLFDKNNIINQIKSDIASDESDDDLEYIEDLIDLPNLCSIRNNNNKIYQYHLVIDNGVYEGTVDEQMVRNGLGIYSINNGEEYYCGQWRKDNPNGDGFKLSSYGAITQYGKFNEGVLIEGFGKQIFEDGYIYEGQFKENKLNGLGSLSTDIKGISNEPLKLIALWKNGKANQIYFNQIETFYENYFNLFNQSLKDVLITDDFNLQRKYFNVLLDLLNKRYFGINMLKEIIKNNNLPKDLRIASSNLVKIDEAHENLNQYLLNFVQKKSYTDLIKTACSNGLKLYTNRLTWTGINDDEFKFLSAKSIFESTINQLFSSKNENEMELFEKILKLDPNVILIVKKMIAKLNEKLYQTPSQYQQALISTETKRIKSIWNDYINLLKSPGGNYSINSNDMSNFYVSSYFTLLKNYKTISSEIKFEFKDENNLLIFYGDKLFKKYENLYGINLIHIDSNGMIKSNLNLNSSYNQTQNSKNFIEFFGASVSDNELIVITISPNSQAILDRGPSISHIKVIDSILNDLKETSKHLIVLNKSQEKIKMLANGNSENKIEIIYDFSFYDNSATKTNTILIEIKDTLRQKKFETFEFVLNEFKPWRDLEINRINKFFSSSYSKLSIKNLSDCFLLKLLSDSTSVFNDYLKAADTNKMLNNFQLRDFSSDFEKFKNSYQQNLLKDTEVNYEWKVKEITQIIDYFLSIFIVDSNIKEVINVQLSVIKKYIESKQNLSKLIKLFVDFNEELKIYILKLDEKIEESSRVKFESKRIEIISKLESIFKMIFSAEKTSLDESLNEFDVKYHAVSVLTNLITGIDSLDYKWYVEARLVPNKSIGFIKLSQNESLLIASSKCLQVDTTLPHYVLDSIVELLDLILKGKILIEINEISDLNNLSCISEFANSISKSFKYFSDQIKYNSLESFKNDCVEPFRDILNEKYSSDKDFKEKLDKIEMYFLYTRKLKEISFDQALELFKEKNNTQNIDTKYLKEAFKLYETKFNKYFDRILKKDTTIESLVNKAQKEGLEWQKETKKNLQECSQKLRKERAPKMLAILSVVFSLKVSNFLEYNQKKELVVKKKENFNQKYFLKPHCIQIIGILKLLSIDKNNDGIKNHLAEILTGQGKSWALALLAGFFSLIGYKVHVACYNEYLTRRDKEDFLKYMEPFKFNQVDYLTLEELCNEKLNSKSSTSLRQLIKEIVCAKPLKFDNVNNSSKDDHILLVDEVDVFFTDCFGTTYRGVVLCSNENLKMIQKYIWESIALGKFKNLNDLKLDAFAKLKSAASSDKMIQNLNEANILSQYLNNMIDEANYLFINREKEVLNYKIINNCIYRKVSNGKFVSSTYFGYKNLFCYLMFMFEQNNSFDNVKLNESCYGYLYVGCGNISYSEIPKDYAAILGVSGSVSSMSTEEKKLLADYKIDDLSFYPSFFGKQNLSFNPKLNFKIRSTKTEWFESIVAHARKIIEENRATLIFFENETLLDEFRTYSGDLGTKPLYVTLNKTFDGDNEKSYSDKEVSKIISMEYAGHHGNVTLLTRDFGRGVDYQVEAKVTEKGGIHVIQTFFSVDIKEEIQIKGRTARKDERGSYEIILFLEDLKNINHKDYTISFPDVNINSTYEELNSLRNEKINEFCESKIKHIEKLRKNHCKTLEFYESALINCNEINRVEYLKEIYTLND